MKTFIILFVALMLTGCAIPKNPSLEFGKKCHVKGENITYSYVWLFDKSTGNPDTEAQCVHLQK